MYIAKLKTIYSWNRKRNNILWYNPPTHQHRTQIPCLVDKHFPKDHKLKKIFNRNTIKISYNCMNNTKQIIDSHNKRILTASIQADDTAAAATINNKTQLPTKERIPARRELPAAISNLPSHRHTQRQQHDRNLHRTHRKRLQNKIKKPHRIIPPRQTQKLYRTQQAHLDPQRQKHRALYLLAHSLVTLAVQQLK